MNRRRQRRRFSADFAGIGRARRLREGKIQEAVIPVKELNPRSRIFLVNSVRGLWEARLER